MSELQTLSSEQRVQIHHDELTALNEAYFEAEARLQYAQAKAFDCLGADVLGLPDVPQSPHPEDFGVTDEHWASDSLEIEPELLAFFEAEGQWLDNHGWAVQAAVESSLQLKGAA